MKDVTEHEEDKFEMVSHDEGITRALGEGHSLHKGSMEKLSHPRLQFQKGTAFGLYSWAIHLKAMV